MKTTFKTVLSILPFLALATQLFAQGTVVFQNNVPGVLRSHVYYHPTQALEQLTGNGAGDLPPGSRDWSGFVPLSGGSYLAALLAAPWANDPLKGPTAPQLGSVAFGFGTGVEAGFVQGGLYALPGVPKDATVASIRVFAWDNSSGKYSDPIAAWNAWQTGMGLATGLSAPVTINNIGGDVNPAPYLIGLESFNVWVIPEPSAAALLVLGATTAWLRRRQQRG
jgi:hypothetical protein